MPSSENQDEKRGGRPHATLFWIGVGLAPLDALLVLASSGTTMLRLAIVLAIIAVVLIGLSIMLRPDTSARTDIEETLYQELDGLHAAVREDITSAARATHASFGEKLQAMYEHVEALRGQLDTARGQLESMRGALGQREAQGMSLAVQPAATPAPRPIGTAMVGGGVVRHTETVQVTTRQTIVDPSGGDDRGRVGDGHRYAQRGGESVEAPPMRRIERDDWPERGGHGDWSERVRRDEPMERAGHGDWSERVRRDEPVERAGHGDWSERVRRDEPVERAGHGERGGHGDWGAPREESWTEQRLRERPRETGGQLPDDLGRFAPAGGSDDAGDTGYPDPGDEPPAIVGSWTEERRDAVEVRGRGGHGLPGRSRHSDDSDDDIAEDPHWSGLRAGDRWASVRSDEYGRELRMGERRAAVRNDGAGTEVRIEDRWTAVRREEATRGEGRRGQRDEPRRARREREESWSAGGDQDDWPGMLSGGRGGQPELPVSEGNAPAWSRDWREESGDVHPERERDDWWAREEQPPRPGGRRARAMEYEMTEDRWR